MAVAISNTGGDIPGVSVPVTTGTYSNVSIGTAASDRIVVVCVGTELTGSVPTAATIDYGTGAQSMTAAESAVQGAVTSHIFYLSAPTGTTATIVVTYGAALTTAQNKIAVFRVVGASTTPTDTGFVADTDADPISSGALTIPTDGGGIAICSDATDTTLRDWTGFNEDLDLDAGAFRFSTGTLTGAATPTITVSGGNNEDGALSWIIFGPPFTLTQAAFRFYDDGTESGSTALAAQDTSVNINYLDDFALRIRVQEVGGKAGLATDDYKLRVSENAGSYIDGSSGTKVVSTFSTGLVEGSATTNRLTGGAGSFVAGLQDENNFLQENIQLTASNFTEHVWGLVCAATAVANNDTVDFRLQCNNSGTFADFSSYTVTPRITVKRAIISQASFRFYEDGTEAGSTAIAAQDTNITRNTTTSPRLHVRVRVQETNGFGDLPSGAAFKLLVSKNGGAYGTLDTSDWSIDTLSGLADDNPTTNRLGAGTGSFYAGLQEELSTTGQTANIAAIQANNYTEFVWAIQATGAGAFINDNFYDFKAIMVQREHPTLGTELDSYSQIPRITITGGSAAGTSLVFDPVAFFRPFIVR